MLHVDAGEASLYLDHRQDEVDDGASVEHVVPRLVSEELDRSIDRIVAGGIRRKKRKRKSGRGHETSRHQRGEAEVRNEMYTRAADGLHASWVGERGIGIGIAIRFLPTITRDQGGNGKE